MTPDASTAEPNKATVRRLVEQVLVGRRLELIEELYAADLVGQAREWIVSFRASFSNIRMEIDELIAEGDTVVGHFTCSATHTGTWLGHPPTGRRFHGIHEVCIYRLRDAKITHAWVLEDNLARLRQLGLHPRPCARP
jgi:predicted ester cyclase